LNIRTLDYEQLISDQEGESRRLIEPAVWNGMQPACGFLKPGVLWLPPATHRYAGHFIAHPYNAGGILKRI